MGRWVVVLAVVAGGVLSWSAARADGPPPDKTELARAHVKAAIAYYDEARYEDAAREMNAAYALKPLADLQYNLAQCYERLNRLDEAVVAYQKYYEGSPDAPDRDQVRARILNLKERADAIAKGQSVPAAQPVEKVVFKTIVVYKALPPPPGRAARWAAYGCWVLAAGGLATGVAFSVLAKQAADSVTHGGSVGNPPPFDGTIRSTQDSGKNDPIIAGVGFAVGALALGGGVALYLIGNKIDREAPKVTLAPSFGPSGGGLVALGRF